LTGTELRQSFTEFFVARNHRVVPSSSVVPWDDPTLLFTNAGMNQFKDVFLGQTSSRDYSRAVSSQKCIRAGGKHNDLDDVGKSPIHHTFFEMLGNWSFGDYYKEEAIIWAWQLLTEEWKLPSEKLWVTVFRDDDDAEKLWQQCTNIDPKRILRFDEKDNFWEMGETGPCGPSSEIHYDSGPDICERKNEEGHVCRVNGDCSRYKEIWNLVFIQYNRDISGALMPLSAHHVDTGMGFERMLSILQNVDSNYETDVFQPLIDHLGELTTHSYEREEMSVPYRVIADHVRSLSFAIADGAIPSNEGRGYVLRRILRRASRYGRKLGLVEPFLYQLVPTLSENMGEPYPELRVAEEKVQNIIKAEEEAFGRTLDHGLELFEGIVNQAIIEERGEIRGREAFKLYDTFGFPVDLTILMASEKNLTVDIEEFEVEMTQQKKRSSVGGKIKQLEEKITDENLRIVNAAETLPATKFVGYELTDLGQAEVLECKAGIIVLSETPFYAEAGGQLGDIGWLKLDSGQKIEVENTYREGDVVMHRCNPAQASVIKTGMVIRAQVDKTKRHSTARNHTATHLLHAVLRETLGDHIAQRGSEVSSNRLRFDFSHFQAIDPETLDVIESKVNKLIWQDMGVDSFITNLEEARNLGALAFFTEKYGESVRVIKIGDVSLELCGGTHINHTGDIGLFRLIRESGIAAGERRIEGVTGAVAYQTLKQDEKLIGQTVRILKCDKNDLTKKAESLTIRIRELEQHIRELDRGSTQNWVENFVDNSIEIEGVSLVASQVECLDIDSLRAMGDTIRNRLQGCAVGVLFSIVNEQVVCIVVVTDKAISEYGLHAGTLARGIATEIGGGGGGKAHMAQAGGKDTSLINKAIEKLPNFVRNQLRNI
tara:strand:- start:75405 stop:78053 length:2649 start_codon:yes stop_codon:yes gene_type:complete